MIKYLFIVRHAKSSREDPTLPDWKRPLNEEGRKRAERISKILKQKNILPDKFISSHAVRAYDTALIFAAKLGYPDKKIGVSKNIYEQQVPALIEVIRSTDKSCSSLMIFGHNPGFTDLYNYLSGENISKLSTSAVACLTFDVKEWKQIGKGLGKIKFIETGKS